MPPHEQATKRDHRRKHGMCYSIEYRHWVGMRYRCRKEPHYVDNGITVCDEWDKDFMAFYLYIGPKPFETASVDRIDGLKGYEPGNVRWATLSQQNRNLTYRNGKAKRRVDDAERLGLHKNTLLYRDKNGIPIDAPKYGEHTHCPNGHEYTENSHWITSKGVRKCRSCRSATMRRYRKKLRAELIGLNNKTVR